MKIHVIADIEVSEDEVRDIQFGAMGDDVLADVVHREVYKDGGIGDVILKTIKAMEGGEK